MTTGNNSVIEEIVTKSVDTWIATIYVRRRTRRKRISPENRRRRWRRRDWWHCHTWRKATVNLRRYECPSRRQGGPWVGCRTEGRRRAGGRGKHHTGREWSSNEQNYPKGQAEGPVRDPSDEQSFARTAESLFRRRVERRQAPVVWLG